MALTKEQIKEFKEAEGGAEKFRIILYLAGDIAKAGDKEWAKKVYKKAENKASSVNNYIDIAESINEHLNEEDWAKKLYCKAEKECPKENYLTYITLANSIIETFNDRKWGKELYKKAEKTEGSELGTVGCYIISDFGDKEWGKKVLEKGLNEAVNNKDKEQIKSYEELIKELC